MLFRPNKAKATLPNRLSGGQSPTMIGEARRIQNQDLLNVVQYPQFTDRPRTQQARTKVQRIRFQPGPKQFYSRNPETTETIDCPQLGRCESPLTVVNVSNYVFQSPVSVSDTFTNEKLRNHNPSLCGKHQPIYRQITPKSHQHIHPMAMPVKLSVSQRPQATAHDFSNIVSSTYFRQNKTRAQRSQASETPMTNLGKLLHLVLVSPRQQNSSPTSNSNQISAHGKQYTQMLLMANRHTCGANQANQVQKMRRGAPVITIKPIVLANKLDVQKSITLSRATAAPQIFEHINTHQPSPGGTMYLQQTPKLKFGTPRFKF